MLPSFVANLIWGPPESEESGGTTVEHRTAEEPGDWLLITCDQEDDAGDSPGSRLKSDSDCESLASESLCSEGSWVITPATPFRASSQSHEVLHPMEDLLIEHPTMSVYHHLRTNGEQLANAQQDAAEGGTHTQEQVTRNRNIPANRQLVLLRNRQRHKVAAHLQLPLVVAPKPVAILSAKPPKMTRRALRRQNINLTRGKPMYRLQNNSFRAGRRRC